MCLIFVDISAQSDIFEWKDGVPSENKQFIPIEAIPLNKSHAIYTYKTITVETPNQKDSYAIKLIGRQKEMDADAIFDGFFITHKGKTILEYVGGSGPLRKVRYITMNKNEPNFFVNIPLDDTSFALVFGGLNYAIDDAPEMVIVVIKSGQAKVVFDNYAYSYAYTAPPNFSMEYVDEIGELYYDNPPHDPEVTPQFLSTQTKHKIWREGNMLKYKSWK